MQSEEVLAIVREYRAAESGCVGKHLGVRNPDTGPPLLLGGKDVVAERGQDEDDGNGKFSSA